jgi:NAD(P)-dependent dehydrogenase (short-subunit alcohol dehydrogenase family)
VSPVVVVTGASAGVGRAIAQEYARRGARLGLIARGAAGLAAARRDCLRAGASDVQTVQADVADPDAVEAAAERFSAALGGLDVWVNNAMVSVFAATWDITAAEYRRVIEVNYLGTVYGTLAALGQMRPRNHGVIVQIGSTLAYRGIPLQAPYCASKHAIQGFFDSLRAELLRECPAVRVTVVQLPALNTPQFSWVRTRLPRHPQPVPPIYQPEVAARAVVWAAEHTPRELTVGWQGHLIRAANALAPGLVDRYLARTGYEAQQTGTEIDLRTWRDNLDSPVDQDRDFGAHGEFDDRAHATSPALWVATHKGLTATAVAGLGALAAAVLVGRRS